MAGADIVVTMSAFTATHSLTLTAAALGWVHVPQPPVEACIALSIRLRRVARSSRSHRGRPGITARWPWVVSFTFGLMHGFGFAGALAEVGLPQSSIPIALLFFNVGVEIGQLLFVGAVLAVIAVGWRAATTASIVATRLALAHRAVCHWRASRASGWSNESPRSDHIQEPGELFETSPPLLFSVPVPAASTHADRQRETEGAAPANPVLHPYSSAMTVDNAPGNERAESVSRSRGPSSAKRPPPAGHPGRRMRTIRTER